MDSFEAALARAEAAVHDDHFDPKAACEALLAVFRVLHATVANADNEPAASEPES